MFPKEDFEEEEQKKPPAFPPTLHLSEGNKHLHLRQYEKAINCFNTILETDLTNANAHLGLAKSFMDLGRLNEAKQNIESILKLVPNHSEAIRLKGDIDYLQGDFEAGFLNLWSESLIHPNRSSLRLGYQICAKAIDNSLYPGTILSVDQQDVEQVNKLLQSMKKDLGQKFFKKKPEPHSVRGDMKFIKALLQDKNVETVHPECKDLLDYLDVKRKFWNMQNPNRARRPFKPKMAEWIKKAKLYKLEPEVLYEMARIKYLDCQEILEDGDFEKSLEIGLETLAVLENINPSYLHTSQISRLKAETFHLIGLNHMFKNDYSAALLYFERELNLGINCSYSDLKLKALLCIGEIFLKQSEYKKALYYLNRCLPIAELKPEKSVIYYKVADCQMNLDQFQKATEWAEKSLEIATADNDNRLQLDVTLLLSENAVKSKKVNTAKDLYSEALSMAFQNSDPRTKDIECLVRMFDEKLPEQNEFNNILQLSEKT